MLKKLPFKNKAPGLFFFLALTPLFFSGCALSGKLSFPSKNVPSEKSTNLTNAQKLNQQALNNPIPLVPAPAKTAVQSTDPNSSTNESMTPSENSPTYDQENWKSLAEKYSGAILKTNLGSIEIKFFGQQSPLSVGNFIELAQKNFYDQTKFHRVIKNFMIQGGDPNSKDSDWSNDGQGGPGYKFPDEQGSEKLIKGALAMANSGPNTNGSQFFFVTADATAWLDGKHTVFGKAADDKSLEVIETIEKVKTNEKDHPTEDVTIESIELLEAEKTE